IKCALDPVTPRNEGSYRSVSVDAPLGSILNPHYPAPCNARQLTGHLLAGAIFGALAQAVPEKVIAECGGAPTLRSVYSGTDRQKYPAKGLLGGRDGGLVEIQLADGTRPHPKSRSVLKPGEHLIMRFGGGAGYGDPREREREAVESDLKNGYISGEAARGDYG